MSDPSQQPWSNNPNAPQITYAQYFAEKSYFAGFLIGAILYGIVIVLFFQCMEALFNYTNRTRGGFKWGLALHTAAMFTFATVYTATTLDLQSISFIDNREFPGADGVIPSGPVGYQLFVYSDAIGIVPQAMYLLNGWLADGLLLYRFCIIYAMNRWAIAFPCLMFLASFAMGIASIYESSRPGSIATGSAGVIAFGATYFTISSALNVTLTMMIVIRLILHRRNIRTAMGSSTTAGGLYEAIVTILVESCALYAVTFLLFIVPWALGSYIQYVFLQILAQNQVIAPFLIVLRLANRSALTSDTVISGNVGTMQFRSQEMSTVSDVYPTGPAEAGSEGPGELSAGAEKAIDLYRDRISGSLEESSKA